MTHFHVNLVTDDLPESLRFYRALFNAEPTVHHDDYAKWVLDEPALNFAITTHGSTPGIDHIGLQFGTEQQLGLVRERLAEISDIADQPAVECCYAQSTKAWARDPNGVAWEGFVTSGSTTSYGDGGPTSAKDALLNDHRCCGSSDSPKTEVARCC